MSWQRELAQEAGRTTDPERLRALADHRLTRVRVAVASNPATPADVLAVLAEDRHHLPRYAVTHNPSPSAVTAALASDEADVRMVLGQRRDLDDDTYDALLADPDWQVRSSVVTSTDRPDLVARAARSDDPRIRAEAAQHQLCSTEDFEMLSRDPRAEVRAEVATRPDRWTAEIRERLQNDRSGDVRWAAAAHSGGSWPDPGAS